MRTPVEIAAGRVMEAYRLILDVGAAENMRAEVMKYLEAAHKRGEINEERLAVSCLKHFRASVSARG